MIITALINITTQIKTAFGNEFLSNEIKLPDFAEKFIEKPTINYFANGIYTAWAVNHTEQTATNMGTIQLVRAKTLEAGTYTINVIAVGRWK